MNTCIRRKVLFPALVLFLVPGMVIPVFAKHKNTLPGSPADGIIFSRHNLTKIPLSRQTPEPKAPPKPWNAPEEPPPVPEATYGSTDEFAFIQVCNYCHTPHERMGGSNPSLWQTTLQDSYKTYGTTIAGTTVTGISGSSLACLACHDGVTTSDRLINSPSQSYIVNTGSMGLLPYFLADGVVSDVRNFSRLKLGGDLNNDHPISIRYNPEVASLRDPATVISSIDLSLRGSGGKEIFRPIVRGNYWSVAGAISDKATIQDILKSGSVGPGTGQFVQCATCHDPHYKNQTNPESEFVKTYLGDRYDSVQDQHADPEIDGLFLRRVGGNTDSGVCRTCHNKS
ncbi:MAG: hypothetical protein ACE5FU_03810 [Nitrospinota bacterium]